MYARRGQCFTTTKYISKLDPSEIRIIPDIKRDKEPGCRDSEGQYCFTDGCGNISLELSKMINEKLGLYTCTAY
jgi:RNA dependent RNA polymerase